MLAENTSPFPCIAVDTSFMAAYILNGYCSDELSDCIKDVEYILNNNGQFYVPQLFWYEIENVLLYKIRKNKKGQVYLSKSDVMDIIYDLQQLPIYTDLQPDGEIRQRIFDMAEEHNLSYYDASYLELARRYSIPLKTYDADLSAAFESYRANTL
ncbi:MAG: type II toxin-antitoxin system VapC family toxin [Treponema sp.]|nr:type II toxin-antitoxin system VapC family toxin [Treponema sp.]